MRIAIGNHKGGSGKTASTVNLAAQLVAAGNSVLVVDMDPQANATRRLGISDDQASLTTAEVVRSGETGVAAEAIMPTGWGEPYDAGLGLVPARFDLENRISEAAVVGASGRLRRALDGADTDYAITLLDCPPSLGHLTQLVLAAADVVLGTVEPEYDSVQGAVRLRDFVHTAAGDLGNPNLDVVGYVVSRVRAGLGAHGFQVEGMHDLFGADRVWSPSVPERAIIKDAADAAAPLTAFSGTPAREVQRIYAELATHVTKVVAA